jgi:hypothetical protein
MLARSNNSILDAIFKALDGGGSDGLQFAGHLSAGLLRMTAARSASKRP